jgi:hypothetical protein
MLRFIGQQHPIVVALRNAISPAGAARLQSSDPVALSKACRGQRFRQSLHGRIGLRVAHWAASAVDNRRTRGRRPALENRVCDDGVAIQYRHCSWPASYALSLEDDSKMLKSYRAHIEVNGRRDFRQRRKRL